VKADTEGWHAFRAASIDEGSNFLLVLPTTHKLAVDSERSSKPWDDSRRLDQIGRQFTPPLGLFARQGEIRALRRCDAARRRANPPYRPSPCPDSCAL